MNLKNDLDGMRRVVQSIEDKAVRDVLTAQKKQLDATRAEIALLYERYGDADGVLTMPEVQKYDRLTKTEKAILVAFVAAAVYQTRITEKALTDIYTTSYYRTGYAVEKGLGVNTGFAKLTDRLLDTVWKNDLDRIGWPYRTKQNAMLGARQVQAELASGLRQGKSYTEIARAVKDITGKKAWEAERIVRTEAHRIREEATWSAYDEAEKHGVEGTRTWVSTLDDRTRDMHQDMDGREATIITDTRLDGEEKYLFQLPDGAIGYPGNTGEAHHDINCRCDTAFIIEGFAPQTRRARFTDAEYAERKAAAGEGELVPRSEVIANMSYHEWARMKGIE